MALGFYNKLGFDHLNSNCADQKVVIDFLAKDHLCFPKYVSFLTKFLQIDRPRWYVETAKAIKNLDLVIVNSQYVSSLTCCFILFTVYIIQ